MSLARSASSARIETGAGWLVELARNAHEPLAQTWSPKLKAANDELQMAIAQRNDSLRALEPLQNPNRVAGDVEKRIPCGEPAQSGQRQRGRCPGVWVRHDIETRHKRLLRLEQHAREKTIVLSEDQIRLLERHSSDLRSRHIEASRPGELLNQDTFYWGTLKGVGKVYVQFLVYVSCSFGFAKVYTSKMPITACDLLNDRVLPFCEHSASPWVPCSPTMAANSAASRRAIPTSPCSQWREIKHRTTKVRSPRTNRFVERLNRALLDECFRVQGRTKWYVGPDEIHADLDLFMAVYNFQRTHQGYRVAGRTPAKALFDLLAQQRALPPISEPEEPIRLAG